MKKIPLTRYIPQGYTEYKPELGDYPKDLFACYVKIDPNAEISYKRFSAIFYIGKQSKANWFYNFPTEEKMKKKINDTISRLMSWEDMKQERKEARKTQIAMAGIGSIFYTSWGYNMTNVEFFQVVKETAKTIWVKELGQVETSTGYLCGTTVPVSDSFYIKNGEQEPKTYMARKRVHEDSKIDFTVTEYPGGYGRSCWEWEGQPVHFNHCD